MDIPFIQKSSLLLLSTPPGGSLTENRHFSFAQLSLCKITPFFSNKRGIGAVGLPVDNWLDVGPKITVLRWTIHQQEGLQLQWLSGYRKKAVVLHKGSCANEKCLFSVKELPGGVDSSRRLLFFINGISTVKNNGPTSSHLSTGRLTTPMTHWLPKLNNDFV